MPLGHLRSPEGGTLLARPTYDPRLTSSPQQPNDQGRCRPAWLARCAAGPPDTAMCTDVAVKDCRHVMGPRSCGFVHEPMVRRLCGALSDPARDPRATVRPSRSRGSRPPPTSRPATPPIRPCAPSHGVRTSGMTAVIRPGGCCGLLDWPDGLPRARVASAGRQGCCTSLSPFHPQPELAKGQKLLSIGQRRDRLAA